MLQSVIVSMLSTADTKPIIKMYSGQHLLLTVDEFALVIGGTVQSA